MKLRIIIIIIAVILGFSTTYPISWAETYFDLDLSWITYLSVLFTLFVIWLILSLPAKKEGCKSSKTWPLKSRREKLILFIGFLIATVFAIFPTFSNIDNFFWRFLFLAIGLGMMVLFIQIFGTEELKDWLFQKESDE